MRAAGADRVEVFRFASPARYFFESNTRSASILGVVGAGGIGYHLVERIRQNNWDEVALTLRTAT